MVNLSIKLISIFMGNELFWGLILFDLGMIVQKASFVDEMKWVISDDLGKMEERERREI